MNERLSIKGRIAWKLERDGVVIQSGERDNIITTAGKTLIATLLAAGTPATLATHISFGSSNTPVSVNDTSLGAELSGNGYARKTVTRSNPVANVSQYQAILTGLTAAVTVKEVGLTNALTGGTLIAHQLTDDIPLSTAADSLTLTWQIEVK